MRRHLAFLSSTITAVIAGALAAGPASAGNAWDEIRGSVFGATPIEDGRGIVTLGAPNRPEDMRAVPISIAAAFTDGRTVKTVSFLIDENPTPVVAVFHMGTARESVLIKSNFRVDRQSDVRAVVEASDGRLYMVAQLVKFAGGQASCSAPPMGDPAEILASMGKMKFAAMGGEASASSVTARGKIEMSHPNHTGMVMDQQTLLYTPMKMVSEITVRHGQDLIFTAEGSIAFSQNRVVEFDFKRSGAGEIDVTLKDTDGGTWSSKFAIAPQS